MKVLLANAPGDLRLVDMPMPEVGPRDVLCKVCHTGICATDAAIAAGTLTLGDGMNPIYPVRLGHEWSGVVVETGKETRRLKAGDRVISDTGYSCGECEQCLKGEYQNCEFGRPIGTINQCWPGAFSEYMLMPERLTFKVADNVPLDEAAVIEPASIGLYGLLRAGIAPDLNLLVIGTGPIGLGGMACARAMGIGRIMLAGRKDKKLEIGRQLGADTLIDLKKEDLVESVMKYTGGRGADIVLDSTGAPELFNDVMLTVRSSGKLVIPGFYEQELNHVKLDRIIVRNITLIGAAGTPNIGRKILSLLENGRMSLKPIITDRFPFSKVVEAFAAVKERNDSRVKILVD
ncbi:MAG: alcohol dehydrogenase catalytic domain-containing protein, partial [Clostridia bacterium]|nr:alcohol dehydrogenase catalytic domain-containing protein [Clostridia bacterium]